MGVGGISIWQLLIILVIVLLLFGTKRLKNIGSDLGEAIRGFRSSMASSDKDEDDTGEPSPLGKPDTQTRTSATDPASSAAPPKDARRDSQTTPD